MTNALEILDLIKIKDLQNKSPKKLFDTEKIKIDQFYSNREFLQNFINDFQGKKEVSHELTEKYMSLLGGKHKKEDNSTRKNVFEDILEKIISSEQEFQTNATSCFEAVQNDER